MSYFGLNKYHIEYWDEVTKKWYRYYKVRSYFTFRGARKRACRELGRYFNGPLRVRVLNQGDLVLSEYHRIYHGI
jgi:hypothetical protein